MQHWRGYRLRMISTMVAVPDISTEAVPGGNETVPMRLGVVARCNSLPEVSSIDTANPGVSSDFINMVQPVEPAETIIVIVPLSAYAVAALRSKACIACRVSPPWVCTSNPRLAGVGMFTLKERMESSPFLSEPRFFKRTNRAFTGLPAQFISVLLPVSPISGVHVLPCRRLAESTFCRRPNIQVLHG